MRRPGGHRSESRSCANIRCKVGKSKSMNTQAKRSLEENRTERPHSKVFVEVPGGPDLNCKEVGELSQAEMRTLEPGLRIRVVNRLLERYVVERGHNDLLVGRHPHTRDIRDTTANATPCKPRKSA